MSRGFNGDTNTHAVHTYNPNTHAHTHHTQTHTNTHASRSFSEMKVGFAVKQNKTGRESSSLDKAILLSSSFKAHSLLGTVRLLLTNDVEHRNQHRGHNRHGSNFCGWVSVNLTL